MNLEKEIRLLIEYWKNHDRDAFAPQSWVDGRRAAIRELEEVLRGKTVVEILG